MAKKNTKVTYLAKKPISAPSGPVIHVGQTLPDSFPEDAIEGLIAEGAIEAMNPAPTPAAPEPDAGTAGGSEPPK